jgi:predicted nucleic-acid-binding Zn-ribbon protein
MAKSLNCPKCGNMMERGKSGGQGLMTVRKKGDFFGDTIVPIFCPNCGYVEWYIENKLTS